MVSNEGLILDANKSALKVLGYKRNELIGKPLISTIYSKASRTKAEVLHSKWKESGKIQNEELNIITKNGEERTVLLSADSITDSNGMILSSISVQCDITEQMKAEEQLKITHLGIDHSHIAVFQIDDAGNIIDSNNQACNSLGYTSRELRKMKVWEVDITLSQKKWKEHRKKTRVLVNSTIESIHKRKDGTEFPVEININYIEFQNKGISFSLAKDISKRKKTEEDLRESEEKFRHLAEESPNMIFIYQNGKVVYANKTCVKYTKYKSEELTNDNFNFLSLIDKDSLEYVKSKLNEHGSGKNMPPYEYRLVSKTGDKLDVINSTKLILYKKKPAILGIVTDISARKKADTALHESEERFRRIFEEGQFGITIAGPDFKFTHANPAFCKMIGYTVEELRNKNYEDITKKNRTMGDIESVQALRKGKNNQIKIEKEYVKKNGEILWGSLISTVILDEKKNVQYYLAMIQDITERKNTEKALKKQMNEYYALNDCYKEQNKELKESLKRIQSFNDELETARAKAEESDHLKTAFLANMSHEIRTPMNGIMGFSELLRTNYLDKSDQERYIDIIQQSGERMLNIINDLIDISKIEAKQMEIRLVKTEVNTLLISLFTFFKPETENKQIELILDPFPSIKNSLIITDKTKLTQILTNLIKNSIKYTNAGQINFGYSLKGENLEFYIKDTGIGIESEIQDKIFERFRQADLSADRPYEGAGLGLSISKSFVEMLGGKIWLESAPNEGSTFYFTIPNSVSGKVGIKNKTIATKILSSQNLKKSTILVAEDDDASLLFLQEVLLESETNTLHARNGEEAVQMIDTHPEISLVLMDIKMPLMNGFDATRKIKQMKPNLPVIAQTAFASPLDRQRSIEAGCDDYISKPINKDILLEIIKMYL